MNDGIEEIREDYPYLSEQDIEFAKALHAGLPEAWSAT